VYDGCFFAASPGSGCLGDSADISCGCLPGLLSVAAGVGIRWDFFAGLDASFGANLCLLARVGSLCFLLFFFFFFFYVFFVFMFLLFFLFCFFVLCCFWSPWAIVLFSIGVRSTCADPGLSPWFNSSARSVRIWALSTMAEDERGGICQAWGFRFL